MQKLYDIVFGQNEFDKTKIEVRFEIIKTIINTIELNSIEDFEKLESCIYKIKDQLRVRSSNLNKVIKDPTKPLTKKKVEFILEKLYEIRNIFLNNAFKALGVQKSNLEKPESESREVEEKTLEKEEIPSIQTFHSQTNSPIPSIDPLLIDNSDYSLRLVFEKYPYLSIEFKKEVDLVILKNLSTLLFETQEVHGTNVIIEGKKAILIGRKINDNVLKSLPQISGTNLEDIFYLLEKEKKSINAEFKEEELKEESKFLENKKENVNLGEYKSINLKNSISSKQRKEDSLDHLIDNYEKKNFDFIPNSKPSEDENKIEVEKVDPIEVEKLEKIESNKDNIEIEYKNPRDKNNNSKEIENLIYQDDQIVVYLNKNSQSFGEIIIQETNQKSFSEMNESQLSYVSIFSKIFSSILFDTLQAHGSNIFWNSNGNKLHIIPRFQDDKLNLNWNPQQHSSEFLEQIQNKLLEVMNSINQTGKKSTEEENNEVIEVKKNNGNSEELKNKAQNILDALRKIP